MVRHRTRQPEGGHQRPPSSQSTRCGIAPAEPSDAARAAGPNVQRPMVWRVAMPHGEARPTTSDQSKGVGRASAAGASYQRAVRRCHETLVGVRHSPASECTAVAQQGATKTADSTGDRLHRRHSRPKCANDCTRTLTRRCPAPFRVLRVSARLRERTEQRIYRMPPGASPHHPSSGRPGEYPSGARKGRVARVNRLAPMHPCCPDGARLKEAPGRAPSRRPAKDGAPGRTSGCRFGLFCNATSVCGRPIYGGDKFPQGRAGGRACTYHPSVSMVDNSRSCTPSRRG